MEFLLTDDEKKSIRAFRKLAKNWPSSLWIFATGNSMHIVRCADDGNRVYDGVGGGVDPDYIIEAIDIPHDGGDF